MGYLLSLRTLVHTPWEAPYKVSVRIALFSADSSKFSKPKAPVVLSLWKLVHSFILCTHKDDITINACEAHLQQILPKKQMMRLQVFK